MDVKQLYQHFLKVRHVCTDTRKITKGCIFFALKGDHFNGNTYSAEALEKGAALAVIDQGEYAVSDRYYLVDDVLCALQQLSTHHRHQMKARIISLTGSNGKTTTKELIAAVLSTRYRSVATKGNLNNHIGVPLTLLSIANDTEIAIVEMGANHQKEIEFLCGIAQPDFGYITNFGKAHLEGFGGEAGVIKGKSELYEYIMANKKPIFMNADDPIQLEKLGSYLHKYGFSEDKKDFYNISFISADPFVTLKVEDIVINSQLIGRYNFTNCAAAVLMGKYFNVPLSSIKQAIEAYVPENNRSQLIEKNGHKIILDAYNANPTSMVAALETFSKMSDKVKIAVLGDMFELGESSAREHQVLAEVAENLKIEQVFLVGENFYATQSKLRKFKSFETFKKYFKTYSPPKGASLIIKGSRGMALERTLALL